MYHIIMSADIRNGRIFSVRMSHRYRDWFTGIYLGVKPVHPRVSIHIRTPDAYKNSQYTYAPTATDAQRNTHTHPHTNTNANTNTNKRAHIW